MNVHGYWAADGCNESHLKLFSMLVIRDKACSELLIFVLNSLVIVSLKDDHTWVSRRLKQRVLRDDRKCAGAKQTDGFPEWQSEPTTPASNVSWEQWLIKSC